MSNGIKERISRLLTVKSIITLVLTFVFCILMYKGNIPQEFYSIYLMVISFYFGTQATKEISTPKE